MHSRAVVAEALRLREEAGLGAVLVARRLGLSVGTVRDWHAGKLPRHSRGVSFGDPVPRECPRCGHDEHQFSNLPRAYVYLLGLYLGDGCISAHRRGVYRLRIFLDLRYPEIVEECAAAMREVMPANKVNRLDRDGSYVDDGKPSNVEVSSFSKSWRCLFPQHGPGKKHARRIWLSDWQQELAERWPEELERGLIQSDGCRFINTGRGGWRHPRYVFSNLSSDITSIFCTACDKVGLRWTSVFPDDERKAVHIYVSRKADVARMDEFIGPKR
jgi:hypothetical protein